VSPGERHYDVAIVGAGINGAGIARDAALRGLKTLVIDKNDMCSGCSAISSRLIHGGLRYLEYGELSLVYESLHERRYLRRTAAHLVEPLRICIPIFDDARRGKLLIRLGMLAYDILSFTKKMPNHDMLSRPEILQAEPGLRSEGLRAAARYFDAQVTYAERLVLENLLDAQAAGAAVRTYCEVTSIKLQQSGGCELVYHDNLSGEVETVSADTVVNAAGPWVDRVLQALPRPSPTLIGGTKGSHIIVGRFTGSPHDAFYVEAAADGRPFFIIPWNGQYLIGTTDIRYDEDLDRIRASREEIDYLLAETNRVFPQANLEIGDIHYAYAGVRPLPKKEKGPESAITRRHIIKVHKDLDSRVMSIIGGKLTTYRSLAEQVVDKLAKIRHSRLPDCRTRSALLPGADNIEAARQDLEALGLLADGGVTRMLGIYGGRSSRIADLCKAEPALARTLDSARKVLAAEVVFALREEFAATLTDIVFRRAMVGLDADQGRPLYDEIAAVAAAEKGWDEAEKARQRDELVGYSDSLVVG